MNFIQLNRLIGILNGQFVMNLKLKVNIDKWFWNGTHPSAEDLVDGGGLLERALSDDFGAHLLHVEHESVKRLLDVRFLVLFLAVTARLARLLPGAPAAVLLRLRPGTTIFAS